ncbi:uncharacterized protein DSM5745_04356 [Aspergillus mulundensis]|uniref:F-box domain-containing protein n=1 Tax=Aspergillus mulundensis TaxID=1810919 RepID=A0A3D8SCG3_9EURO|nr:hypothetical protein DSM5745_04356 [Aspergillus mulundensis]RDW84030.1 hypothetical protein DSM5745_04356 [Aspergillus mulundensis]
MATLSSLPQELIDQIVRHLLTNRYDKHNIPTLQRLREVNRAFYWAATRALFCVVEYSLDPKDRKRRAHGQAQLASELISLPHESHDRFIRVVSVTGLRHIEINLDDVPEVKQRLEEISVALSELPALRHLYLDFEPKYWGPYRPREWRAALWCAIQETLLTYPVRLEMLSLAPLELIVPDPAVSESKSEAATQAGNELESSFQLLIPNGACYLTRAIPHLKALSLTAGSWHTIPPQSRILEPLALGTNLQLLRLARINCEDGRCLSLLPTSAPLRELHLQTCKLSADEVQAALRTFAATLKTFGLRSTWFPGASWKQIRLIECRALRLNG